MLQKIPPKVQKPNLQNPKGELKREGLQSYQKPLRMYSTASQTVK